MACEWLKQPANQARWSTWIEPPPQCTTADYDWSASACDMQTNLYTVTYAWLQPKACVNGVVLPTPDTAVCELSLIHI